MLIRFHAVVVLLILSCLLGSGCGNKTGPTAILLDIQGKVECRLEHQGTTFVLAQPQMALSARSLIRTKEDGFARLGLGDGDRIEIRANSLFEVGEGTNLGRQNEGNVLYQIQPKKAKTTIETPQGVTAILGTKFLQEAASNSVTISLIEGKVEFTLHSGPSQLLEPGKQLRIVDGKIEKILEMDPFFIEKILSPGTKLPGFNQR
jgi:hypothetical protein